MGITGTIIGLAIFGIVALVAWSIIAPAVEGVIDFKNGFFTATELKPRPTQNETICDVRVKVFGVVTQDFGVGAPEITIDKTNPRQYAWFDCFSQSSPSFLSLVDFGKRARFNGLDFVSFGGEKINVEIVLRDKSDSTQKVDAFTQPHLRRSFDVPAGLVKTPLDASMEFVVTNIPARDYYLEIYYGRPINDMEAGKPFISEICQLGKTSC